MVLPALPAAAMVIVVLALAMEIRAWWRGTRMVTRLQKVYRVAAALMLEGIFAIILMGRSVNALKDPVFQLGYWGAAVILSFGLVAVAMLDLRASLNTYMNRKREILQRIFGDERDER